MTDQERGPDLNRRWSRPGRRPEHVRENPPAQEPDHGQGETGEAVKALRPVTITITALGFCCERCTWEWIPRSVDKPPRVCPKCKSPYWDKPRSRPNYPKARVRTREART